MAKLNTNPVEKESVPELLEEAEIKKRLRKVDGWSYGGGFITKQFEFGRFLDGIEFINKVAAVAEEQEHHPDIHIRYTTVKLSLQTHSEGGVTDWDFELAAAIDNVPVRGLRNRKRGKPPSNL